MELFRRGDGMGRLLSSWVLLYYSGLERKSWKQEELRLPLPLNMGEGWLGLLDQKLSYLSVVCF